MRIAVVDSSPLINLDHLGLTHKLSVFFGRVYVPRAVQQEVNKKGRFRFRLEKLYETGLFAPCTVADETSVKILWAELRGEGESEALVQAQEKNASYFMCDDKLSRKKAGLMSRKTIGTLGILARLNREGLAPELHVLVRKLQRGRSFRVSEELIQQAIESASQPIF